MTVLQLREAYDAGLKERSETSDRADEVRRAIAEVEGQVSWFELKSTGVRVLTNLVRFLDYRVYREAGEAVKRNDYYVYNLEG